MNVFYVPGAMPGSVVTLDENESAHSVRVLRLKNGDTITIVNGTGGMFDATIIDAHPKKCSVSVGPGNIVPPRNPLVHIAIAPTKAIDRFEWFLEKSIEMGANRVTPLLCEKSERKVVNAERLERIVVSAMKQSMQLHKPVVDELTKFSDFVASCAVGQKFIAHCEETQKHSLKQCCVPGKDAVVLIGPEGDFSPREIDLALSGKFIPVTLGNSRLRTETAGVVACHSVIFLNER